MKILGIETSCDETAASVVEDGGRILSNVVASQVELHARYGGIVPEVASRQHLLSIVPVLERAMAGPGLDWQDLDGVAVTVGPGLPGSLLVGLNVAKAIALARDLPLLGVNHLEGHIYAHWLEVEGGGGASFPCLCLIVSGGHSELVLMRGHGRFQSLGRTRDDASGEAFDKAARILGLGYPGGPAIQEAAGRGKASFRLPRARLKGSHDFSFSGVKTALWRLVEEIKGGDPLPVFDLAASFQEAVVDALVANTLETAREYRVKGILLAGGVAANSRLREVMRERSLLPVLIPSPALCTDNAAMIAACGYYHMRAGRVSGWDLDVEPGLRLG
ncbi:MAG: tRNA (adenosine(37)-N6)-threonylcarbamoyltransferase complex transferase subunit TsaD [Dehalococcoidia bacterium]